jgi:twitching motility protein PilT
MVLRYVKSKVPSLDDLNLPPVLKDLIMPKRGLLLMAGATNSGKSTTLAAMIDLINKEQAVNIVTLEDPVEFIYEAKKSIIKQRQLGSDMLSFGQGMKHILRQDPNVIMVGEMRDLATIATTITMAETGHLVFGTLHTNTAASTVDRIIDQFPTDRQAQIRVMLSESLRGVVAQTLCKKIGGGRVAVLEILLVNNAVANLIRERRTHEIPMVIETGSELGMIDMNRSLADHVRTGEITAENAYLHSFNPKALERLI